MTFGRRKVAGLSGVERRLSSTRMPVDIPALILTTVLQPIECRIVSISSTGARIMLRSILGIPDKFELKAFGQTHEVRVVRRGDRSVAVKFFQPLQAMPRA